MSWSTVFLFFLSLTLSIHAAENKKTTDTKFIPLPIYATLPNEGSTYGFMPVFMVVENEEQRTQSIFAPSVSWNRIIRFTGTFRWYYYPSSIDTLTLIPSISSNINRNLTLMYRHEPNETGTTTIEAGLHLRRSLFYRFFGLGHLSKNANETSYTRVGGELDARVGYNFANNWNAGLFAQLERQLVEAKNVDFLPLAPAVFATAPGMGGATAWSEGMSLRYDNRARREYSPNGFAADFSAKYVHAIVGSGDYAKLSTEIKGLWQETSFLQGAARAYWAYTPGSDVPFYSQSTLGGSFRLRGFTEDRFIDKGAWEIELEQRITYLQTHIYGVDVDWRIDPFVALGQVYSNAADIIRHARVSGGLGFRAYVRPNVLGRIDTAVGGDGIKVYVELGYPF